MLSSPNRNVYRVGSSVCRARDPVTGLFTVPLQLGLFARRLIHPRDHIATFFGEAIAPAEAARRTAAGRGGYQLRISRAIVLDCYQSSRDLRCFASFANSARGLWDTSTDLPAVNNAKLCISRDSESDIGRTACLRATRNIFPNQEILFPYQSGYRFPLTPDLLPCPIAAMLDSADSSSVDVTHSVSPPVSASTPPMPPPIVPITRSHLDHLLPRAGAPTVNRHLERSRLDKLPILSFSDTDFHLISSATGIAAKCMVQLFPSGTNPVPHIREFLEEAHRAASTVYGTAAAVAWGGDYRFPPSILQRDLADFQTASNDIAVLAQHRRLASLPVSFSRDRVIATFGSFGTLHPSLSSQDFFRLLRLADVGVDVPVPTRFVPISQPAPLRAKYTLVSSAVHRMLAKQAEAGSVVLLPLPLAQAIPGIHLHNSQHWTTKKGKPQGRSIADMSNTPDPLSVCPVNGFTAEERSLLTSRCVDLYGPIRLPTIHDLMHLVLDMADRHGWACITLWKMDLQGAFNLLWFNPHHVPLMAFPLTDELVVINLVGVFGWLGMPFAFNVLSRALLVVIAAAISGVAAMYVDDVMGCSTLSDVAEDMSAAHSAITGLAGDYSVAPDKIEQGRVLEFIGWVVDLDTRTVTASRRLLLKMLHALFCFHIDDRVSQLHMQRIASLAMRLSMLCMYMRPFTRHLFIESAQFQHNPNARHRLSQAAKSEVWMWRAFVLILQAPGIRLYKNISSFRPDAPMFELHYDASLTQIAVGLYTCPGEHRVLRCFAAPLLPFPVSTDSSRQNTFEYLAVALGLLLATRLNIRDASYTPYGDSVSSLAWAESGRVASSLATRANLAVATISVHLNVDVMNTVHVPGTLNTVYDGLSRGKTAEEVGLPPHLQVFFHDSDPVMTILSLCDPAQPLPAAEDHVTLMGRFIRLVRSIS